MSIKNWAKNDILNVIFNNMKNSENWYSNKYKIFLFWSRATWKFRPNSDYDIWILWEDRLDFKTFLNIKSDLEELPYLIDFVDFKNVDNNFKKIALKNITPWN